MDAVYFVGIGSMDNPWISTDSMYSGNTFPQGGTGSTDNPWMSTDRVYSGNTFPLCPGGTGSRDNPWMSIDTMYSGNTQEAQGPRTIRGFP